MIPAIKHPPSDMSLAEQSIRNCLALKTVGERMSAISQAYAVLDAKRKEAFVAVLIGHVAFEKLEARERVING